MGKNTITPWFNYLAFGLNLLIYDFLFLLSEIHSLNPKQDFLHKEVSMSYTYWAKGRVNDILHFGRTSHTIRMLFNFKVLQFPGKILLLIVKSNILLEEIAFCILDQYY